MCGIILVKRPKGEPAHKVVAKRYKHQDHRGKQGFGYIAINNGYVKNVVRNEDEKGILEMLKTEKSNEIMFHHRLPTSTPNYEGATHPIVVEHDIFKFNYYVIHNGKIKNADFLKLGHDKLGVTYTTQYTETVQRKRTVEFTTGDVTNYVSTESELTKFNDSEAFAVDLARYLEGHVKSITSSGTISFVCLKTNKKGKVLSTYYGHNDGNPLVVETNKSNKSLSNIFILKSLGPGTSVPVNTLNCIDYDTGDLVQDNVEIGIHNVIKPTPYQQTRKQIESVRDRNLRNATSYREMEDFQLENSADIASQLFGDSPVDEVDDDELARQYDMGRMAKLEDDILGLEADIEWYQNERKNLEISLATSEDVTDMSSIQMEIDNMDDDIRGFMASIKDKQSEMIEIDACFVPSIRTDQMHLLS